MARSFALGLFLAAALGVAHAQWCVPLNYPGTPPCWPSSTAVAAFIKSLSNETVVLQPAKQPDQFLTESVTSNLLKSNSPAIIVTPANAADLKTTVAWAFKYGIRVVVQCSGHDLNGRSTGRNVIVIKTEKLNWIEYDEETETVSFGAGATQGQVYEYLAAYNRTVVGGTFSALCPAGCLAGGCYGPLSRQYGLGIDSVVSIDEFVLYDGTTVALDSETEHPELFNAYLGAGANTFGAALNFTVQTVPDTPVLQISAAFSVFDSEAPENATWNLLNTFLLNLTYMASLPLELAGNVYAEGETVYLDLVYTGSDYETLNATLLPLYTSVYALGEPDLHLYDNITHYVYANDYQSYEIWTRKFAINAFIPADQAALDLLTETLLQIPDVELVMRLFIGGATAEGTAGSVPADMRLGFGELLLYRSWSDPHADAFYMDNVNAWKDGLYANTTASYSGEYTSYGKTYNYVTDYQTRFFSNYTALTQVKQQYDPCNTWSVTNGVGWDLPKLICSGKTLNKKKKSARRLLQ